MPRSQASADETEEERQEEREEKEREGVEGEGKGNRDEDQLTPESLVPAKPIGNIGEAHLVDVGALLEGGAVAELVAVGVGSVEVSVAVRVEGAVFADVGVWCSR